MHKVIIIDDEPLAREIVKEYVQKFPDLQLMAECNDGFEAVKAISEYKPDLIFLDVQMPKISGFEMLELLDEPPAVIFTTAFDEYAIKAFEANATDYLLKPFSQERFDLAVNKYLAQKKDDKSMMKTLVDSVTKDMQLQRIVIRDGSKIRIVPLHEVIMLEAADDYVKIHTAKGAFLKKRTMQSFEENLPSSQFVRVHRSYIVNIAQITRIDPMEKENHVALLKDGPAVPLSKAGYQKLKQTLDL
ncbi:MAG: response regulator [Chitinophagaceae bacterium]|nr:MAG: response regulator [Chitinophagaceae bacterium]